MIEIDWIAPEGSEVKPGARVAEIRGRARAVLSARAGRAQFPSSASRGVATLTRAFVRAGGGNRRAHPGHAEDHAEPAHAGEARGPRSEGRRIIDSDSSTACSSRRTTPRWRAA